MKTCLRNYNDGNAHTVKLKTLDDKTKIALCPSCNQPINNHHPNKISKASNLTKLRSK